MKTSVRPNRRIVLGDLTEQEKFWNDYDRELRRERVHLEHFKKLSKSDSKSEQSVTVYSVKGYLGASKTGAWASIIEWPGKPELVHGALSIPLENLALLAVFRTLSCISDRRDVTYYADFADVATKLKRSRSAPPSINKNRSCQLLHNVVGKRRVEWRHDVYKRPQIAFCRKIVAADLKAFSSTLFDHNHKKQRFPLIAQEME